MRSSGTPVGTDINSISFASDPSYAGSAVGFALVGGQTHYTNPAAPSSADEVRW
jgi:hypothetical protein